MRYFMSKVFMATVALAMIAGSAKAQYYNPGGNDQNNRRITVGGEAEIKVVPDQVIIVLGLETIDSSLTISKAKNDKLVSDFTKITKDFGIDPTDIQTDYLNVAPKYVQIHDVTIWLGHQIRRRLVITLKDISKYDNLLTSLVDAGANQIQDVRFQTTELRKYRDQARSLAIKAAAEKANALASELGAKVGKPFNIQDNASNWYSWYNWNDDWGYNRRPSAYMTSQNVIQDVPSDTGEIPMAVGKISVTANVSVTFELE